MGQLEALLVVQHHDTVADQLRHRRETLPERDELRATQDALAVLEATAAAVAVRRDDAERRQRRLEDETESISAKIAELDRKLYSGTISAPKELLAIQDDIDSLKRHRGKLEDQVLEVMEEREPLDRELAELDAERSRLDAESIRLRVAVAEAEVDIDAQLAGEEAARDGAARDVPPELRSLYERLRVELGGVAAARLEPGGRCGGCHLTLPAVEVARMKRESPDTVFRCDQCGRILVRGE